MNGEEDYNDDDFGDAYSEENKQPNAGMAKTEHLDKEVEKVTRKQSAGVRQESNTNGGFALPDDDDDGPGVGHVVDADDEDEDEDDEDDEQHAEEDQDDADHDEQDMDDMDEQEDMDDIEQQIVNITSKNGETEQHVNNDAILVINNQNNIDGKDRPQTQKVKHRQGNMGNQGQRPMTNGGQRQTQAQFQQPQFGAQLPPGLNPQQQQQYYQQEQDIQQQNYMMQDPGYQQQQFDPRMQQPMVRNIQSQGQRRNLMAQVLNNQNQNSMMGGGQVKMGEGMQGQQLDAFKRKKLREMIFGVKQQPQSQSFNYFVKMQKEDLQNHYRNLKITNNITKDENIRLKTKLQQIQQELNSRDKELEKLTIRLQQTLSQPNGGADGPGSLAAKSNSSLNHHFAESFIVSQLKKNNRDLKLEVQEKDRLIEQLKRNIKMTKSQEIEIELTVYIDECLRLRGQLEQALMEKTMLIQQQDMNGMQNQNMNQQRNYEELANLEEAFRYQEMELQKERENSNQLRMQLMKTHEQKEKLKDKQDQNKKRLKKINDLSSQSKRQAGLLDIKVKECGILKEQMMALQSKVAERERVHGQNRDLVTKNCGQQSQIQKLKKDVQDQAREMEQLRQSKAQVVNATNNQVRSALPPKRAAQQSAPPVRPSPGQASVKQASVQQQSVPQQKQQNRAAEPAAPVKQDSVRELQQDKPTTPDVQKLNQKQQSATSFGQGQASTHNEDKNSGKAASPVQVKVSLKEDSKSEPRDGDKVEMQEQQINDKDNRDVEKDNTPSPLIKDDDDEVQQQSEYDAIYDDPSAEKEKKDSQEIKEQEQDQNQDEYADDMEGEYNDEDAEMQKILEQGFLQNFFECPYEYQKVIFMMVKGDQDGLSNCKAYLESQEIFNYYLQCIIEFSQQFDPTETLMIIANDPERREFIHNAPDELVPLSYIITDLWPKLGFLPIDAENPGVALIAEFMLNELILKNSESLDELNLQHLKELFSGDGEDDEDDYEEVEEDEGEDASHSPKVNPGSKGKQDRSMNRQQQQQDAKPKTPSDNYSDDSDDHDKFGAMDIGALRKQNQQSEEKDAKNSTKKSGKKAKDAVKSDSDGYEDDFN